MDYSSLSNYDSNVLGSDISNNNTLQQLNLSKNLAAKSLQEAKGSTNLEIAGVSEMIAPALLKKSGLTNITSEDLQNIGSDLLPDFEGIISSAKSNISSFFNSSNPIERPPMDGATENISMDTFANKSQLTEFESPEFKNPVYEENISDAAKPMTEDVVTNVAKTDIAPVSEDIAVDSTVGALETVGAVATDGILPVVSGVLGLAGLGFGGYSLAKGFMDIFEHPHQSVINYVPQAMPTFEAV